MRRKRSVMFSTDAIFLPNIFAPLLVEPAGAEPVGTEANCNHWP
jgi:hypothetical protein